MEKLRSPVSMYFFHWCSKYTLTFYYPVYDNVPEYNLRIQPIATDCNISCFDQFFKVMFKGQRFEMDKTNILIIFYGGLNVNVFA